MIFKYSAVFCCLTVATYAAVAPGQNAYLPPPQKPGYDYSKPNVPFSPAPQQPYRPTQTPAPYQPQRPAPAPYQPQRPAPAPYQPQRPTPAPYQPQRPAPAPYQPQRPSPPKPVYGVPSPAPYNPPQPQPNRPTQAPYRPTQAPYRPPQPTYGTPSPQQPNRPVGPKPTGPSYVGQPSSGDGRYVEHDPNHVHTPGMPFDFNYAVKDDQYGNDYSHNAVSDGDVTRGEYSIKLPDGRTQVVKYTADWKTGFHAQVRFEGTPTYPAPNYQGRPSNQSPNQVGYPTGPSQPAPGYPSGPARPNQPAPGYPSGPARPSQPAPGFPSGPARPSQPTQGYPSGPSRPSPPQNQIPGGQQYTPNGGYKY